MSREGNEGRRHLLQIKGHWRRKEMKKKGILLVVVAVVVIGLFAVIKLRQEERLFPIKQDGKWGLIDRRGKIVVRPQFEKINFWSEGLTGVEINKKWGFIDRSGRVVIPAEFEWVGMFSEGLAIVSLNGKRGYINKKGEIVVPPKYYAVDEFHEGLATVWPNEKEYGYIDKRGKEVIAPKLPYTVLYPYNFMGWPTAFFSDGLACVWLPEESKWSFMDKKGNIKKWRFDFVQSFSEGLAPVAKETKGGLTLGYIDTRGNLAIDYKFDAGLPFKEGVAVVMQGGRFLYIDKKGRTLLKPDADTGEIFSEGLAKVCHANKCRFIDKKGRVVMNRDFSPSTGPYDFFKGGLLLLIEPQGDLWVYGYIDKTGKYVYKSIEKQAAH